MLTPLLLLACAAPPVDPPAEPAAAAPAVPEPAPAVEALPPPLPDTGPFRREIAPGLVIAAYAPPEIADDGYSRPDPSALIGTDNRLFVVTIDPEHYEIVYLSMLDPAIDGSVATASEWAVQHDLHVAWNPGMFEPKAEATGYTRAGSFVSQPQVRRNGLYRSFFVAEPTGAGPRAAVLDRVPPKGEGKYAAREELPADFVAQLDGYGVVSQSLAILRDGRAAYPPRKNQWSELAYGTDDQGRVIVLFSRWPYEMRELGRIVEALDIGATALLHGEGGPEATLAVRAGGVEWVRFGSYETDFFDDRNVREWALPAVMGARPRKR